MSSTPITSGMLPDDTFKDQTVIITGGGTGLGKSMAYYLGQLGANLVICSRKQDVLDATAAELIEKTGAEVLPFACDVRDYLAVETMIDSVKEKFGNIHCFINNAAGNFVSPTERLSPKAFDVIVDIVLKGSYNSSLAMGKNWINNKQAGAFLNIVTTYAWTGSGYVVPSACAKAGVLALTRSLAVEWAKYSIRCNAIAPGPFPTEGAWTRLFPGEFEKMFSPENKIPLKRYGEHQELANLAAYLLSGYASYMTGEVVTIDGGEWLKGAGEFNMLDEVPANMWDMMEKKRKR